MEGGKPRGSCLTERGREFERSPRLGTGGLAYLMKQRVFKFRTAMTKIENLSVSLFR